MRYLDGVTGGEDGEDAIDAVLHGIRAWAEHPGARRVTAEALAELAAQSRVSRVGRVRLPATASPSRSLAEMLPGALGSIEARGTGEITGVPTGFADLDGLTGGLHPGTLTVIGGGPSVGKSALVLDFCRSASIRHKLPAVLFSLEMTAAEISMRLLSAESRVPVHLMRTGQMTDDNRARLTERMAEIAGVPFYVSESAALSINALSDEAARLVAGKGVRLVAVDYLQLITTDRRFESREREVAEIAQQLKALALDLQVPVVVAAQLNRGPGQRADKRPLLADLRDSGAIAQAADLVVLLHREDAFERESPRAGEADFIVAKHRNGPTATVTVAFQGHYSRFVDMASD
jgi:replicative DNA helicase